MSFNFENIGRPLAEIVKKDDKDTKNNKVVYLAEDFELDKVKEPYPFVILKPGERFHQVPLNKGDRQVIYISGKSGSGKSYYTAEYIKKYIKQNPKNKVIVFSSLSEDKTLDDIKQVKRFKLKDPRFITEEFAVEDFANSLVIFDDTDCIQDKKILVQINKIADLVLQTGRHPNVSMCFTSHLSCAGSSTKMILNESHAIVFFPSSMTQHSMSYLCKTYVGLDTKQIAELKKEKTRWVCSFKTCPSVLMTGNKLCFSCDYGSVLMTDSEKDGPSDVITIKKHKSNDKYICDCGATVLYRNRQRHEETLKHQLSM